MTSTAAATLSRIQKDAFAWQRKNFGETDALTMLVGAAEEYGEACEAMGDTELFVDAVGDTTVYLMQFSSIRGWDIGELWNRSDLHEVPSRAWPVLLGRICHHHAKAMQRYRGSIVEHDERCRAAISALLRHWDAHLRDMGRDFIAVVESTWSVVSQRDWTAERPAPGVSVRLADDSTKESA